MRVIKSAALRRTLKIILPFLLIPSAVAAGALLIDTDKHAFVSLAVTLLSLLFFMTGFEEKKTGTRRLVLVSVTVALSVAGRFIPFFKPITALTVLTGIYLGGEAGFLVGSMSAVISNFYFGQGPWTPFQMLAWGAIGLFSGFFAAPLKKSRAALLSWGVLAGAAFSFIMDIWTVLWYNEGLNLTLYLSAIASALPHTLLYAVSNVIFLALFADTYREKIERIKIKYGI